MNYSQSKVIYFRYLLFLFQKANGNNEKSKMIIQVFLACHIYIKMKPFKQKLKNIFLLQIVAKMCTDDKKWSFSFCSQIHIQIEVTFVYLLLH